MPKRPDHTRRQVVLMAKAPAIGRGKQRLAKELGRVEAWRINRFLHRQACRSALGGPWALILCVSPDSATAARLPGVWPSKGKRTPQGTGDLGARIAAGVRKLKGPLVVIGADCPDMRPQDLARAFKALRRFPAVLGPAADGGFWLVGVRKPTMLIRALPGVRWSTAHAAADIAQALPGPVARLRLLSDIDDAAAWRAYRSRATYSAGRPEAKA